METKKKIRSGRSTINDQVKKKNDLYRSNRSLCILFMVKVVIVVAFSDICCSNIPAESIERSEKKGRATAIKEERLFMRRRWNEIDC